MLPLLYEGIRSQPNVRFRMIQGEWASIRCTKEVWIADREKVPALNVQPSVCASYSWMAGFAVDEIDHSDLFDRRVIHPEAAIGISPRTDDQAGVRELLAVENDLLERPILRRQHIEAKMAERSVGIAA